MLSLALGASLLAVSPPALPDDTPPATPAAEAAPVESPAPAPAPEPAAPEVEAIVIAPPADALPVAEEVGQPAVVVVPAGGGRDDFDQVIIRSDVPRTQAVPKPPWSGAGRFVGGAVALAGGVGLLTAATFEFSQGRDTTAPLISQVPAGVSMLIAGGVMIGTGARDQRRLAEWEAATKIDAKPMGTGLIVGGVTALSLGSMAAIATSIASDMDLNAPRSLPAGWATAGAGLATGTVLLISGIVRRVRYGKWRDRITGTPMVAPTRAGATLGFVGQF
jgi:hypothetical protein